MGWRTWNLPMDAGKGDAIIGTTEDGRPIYRSQLGTQYWQAPRAPKPKPDVASLLPAYGGQYETSKTAPAWAGSQPGLGDFGGVLGGVLGAVMSGVTAPGRALRGQPVTKGDVINTALDWGLLSAPMSAPRGALRAGGMVDDAPKGIKAYHGSPHDFDQFDMSKIGTGEGAQAYGHGLYFAENEAVARGYRDALAGDLFVTAKGETFDPTTLQHLNVRSYLRRTGDLDGAIEKAKALLENANDVTRPMLEGDLKSLDRVLIDGGITRPSGRMYEVNINANPDDFLDWGAPLSEQPRIAERLGLRIRSEKEINDEAYALLDKYGSVDAMPPDARARIDALNDEMNRPGTTQSGRELYEFGIGQQENVHDLLMGPSPTRSADLAQAGIPGIKYLDAGSRGAGTGSRNYVLFDDKLISILRKYGLLPALLGGSGIFNQQQPQG